ncbi:GumC family protein [Flavihumibacter solisilvae]|uniref:non-specific protein-tyrosine kinase n=1 Tax=Flavihumibacter solisilvae TaxID=1349421 RepID=A0A0C1L1V2_9BACT|nr:tyrosine-protein kinase family protein [Flavihumibacter solisilvae]KIC93566.1 hypothetical protein OI18_17695 [Flavihumibacter solisilvae]
MNSSSFNFDEDQNYTKSLIRKYLRHKRSYLLSFIACLVLAYLYIRVAQPLYRIQSSILVKGEEAGSTLSLNISELDMLTDMQSIENEIQIIRSNTVLRNVIDVLKLNISYYQKGENDFFYSAIHNDPPVKLLLVESSEELEATPLEIRLEQQGDFTLLNDNSRHSFNEMIRYQGARFSISRSPCMDTICIRDLKINVQHPAVTAEQINKSLNISAPSKNASLLYLTLLHPSKEKGSLLLQTIVNEYNKTNILTKRIETDTLQDIIRARLQLLSSQLNDFEDQEQDFKIRRQITNLGEDAKILLERSKDVEQNIYTANLQLEILKKLEHHIAVAENTVSPPNLGTNDPVLIEMVARFNELQLKKAEMVTLTGQKNVTLKSLDEKIQVEKDGIMKNLAIQLRSVQANIASLQVIKKTVDEKIGSIPILERRLLTIFREKSVRENIYIFLLQKMEEASLSNVDAIYRLRVIDQAYSSVEPVQPNKIIVLASTCFLALLIPTIFINLKSTVDDKVNSKAAIASRISSPIIGEITRMKKFHFSAFLSRSRITIEQFRLLRTRVERIMPGQSRAKKILVTSSTTGEGKSFVSTNLATSFAANKRKTLLIDLDLRNPDIARHLDVQHSNFLNSYLKGEITNLQDIIVQHKTWEDLYILPGTKPLEMIPELPMAKLEEIFRYCDDHFDYIIINTPPFVIISDALQLERFSDATLFVVRQNYTEVRYLELLNASLKKKEFRNLQVVVNDVLIDELYGGEIFKGEYFN